MVINRRVLLGSAAAGLSVPAIKALDPLLPRPVREVLVHIPDLCGPALAEDRPAVREVREIVNVRASSVLKMFRFEPDLLLASPAETVRFVHTAGTHKVASIDGMIPDGVDPIRLPMSATAQTTLPKPGVYGFRCTIHGRFGMVMLIAAGTDWPNFRAARDGMPKGRAGEKFEALFARLEAG